MATTFVIDDPQTVDPEYLETFLCALTRGRTDVWMDSKEPNAKPLRLFLINGEVEFPRVSLSDELYMRIGHDVQMTCIFDDHVDAGKFQKFLNGYASPYTVTFDIYYDDLKLIDPYELNDWMKDNVKVDSKLWITEGDDHYTFVPNDPGLAEEEIHERWINHESTTIVGWYNPNDPNAAPAEPHQEVLFAAYGGQTL